MEQNFDIEDIVINLYLEALQEKKLSQDPAVYAREELRLQSIRKFDCAAEILAEAEWSH